MNTNTHSIYSPTMDLILNKMNTWLRSTASLTWKHSWIFTEKFTLYILFHIFISIIHNQQKRSWKISFTTFTNKVSRFMKQETMLTWGNTGYYTCIMWMAVSHPKRQATFVMVASFCQHKLVKVSYWPRFYGVPEHL